jgi:hypothetical protein
MTMTKITTGASSSRTTGTLGVALAILLCALGAPGGANGQQRPGAARLHVYDVDGQTVVRTTPQQGRGASLGVLEPSAQRPPAPDALPVAAARPYVELAISQALAHGLEPALVLGVIEAESHFNPRALSHAGAAGLMQLMPVHWTRLAGGDPYDPEENVRVGCGYLARLLTVHRGDLHRALAAYNTGSARVRREGGPPGYTLGYVARIVRARARWRVFLGAPHPASPPPSPSDAHLRPMTLPSLSTQ